MSTTNDGNVGKAGVIARWSNDGNVSKAGIMTDRRNEKNRQRRIQRWEKVEAAFERVFLWSIGFLLRSSGENPFPHLRLPRVYLLQFFSSTQYSTFQIVSIGRGLLPRKIDETRLAYQIKKKIRDITFWKYSLKYSIQCKRQEIDQSFRF